MSHEQGSAFHAQAPRRPWIASRLAHVALRVFGVLLIIGAFLKAIDPGSVIAVLRFDGVPVDLLRPSIWAISLWEVFAGALLLFGTHGRTVTAMGALTALIFSVQLAYLLAFPDSPRCGCPGLAYMMREQWAKHTATLASDLLFLASAGVVLVARK